MGIIKDYFTKPLTRGAIIKENLIATGMMAVGVIILRNVIAYKEKQEANLEEELNELKEFNIDEITDIEEEETTEE